MEDIYAKILNTPTLFKQVILKCLIAKVFAAAEIEVYFMQTYSPPVLRRRFLAS